MRFLVAFLCLAAVILLPLGVNAHLGLDLPASRYGPDVLKTGPCGISGGERTENITYYEPGATIDVRWNEYVDHPGHYRIAFDADGVDEFVDPATMMELYSNKAVLLDGIPDEGRDTRDYKATVTLPDIECDNCTLQVIQMMYDKPPYTTPGNDIYYQCADLVLRKGGAPPDAGVGTDAGTGPGTTPAPESGCSTASGPSAGLGVIPLLLALFALRLAHRRGLAV